MSEILESVRSLADPKLKDLFDSLPAEFVEGVQEHIQGGLANRLATALADAAELRYEALVAEDQDTAREYAKGVETALRRVKTMVVAEKIVASEAIGNLLIDGFMVALDAAASVGKTLLTTIATGLIEGVIKGVVSGGEGDGGFDPASLFRGS